MNNEIIICHMTSVHIPFDTRIFHKECKSLAAGGYEVHLVARHDKDEIANGIHIHAIPTRGGKLKRMLLTVIDVYRAAVRIDAAVYHFHDPELIFAGLLLKLRGKKVIADVHEDYPDYIRSKEYIPTLLRLPAAWMTGIFERYSSGFFDAVIVVTPKIFDRFKLLNKNTVTVHNFPILDEFSGGPGDTGSAQKTGTVAYIGNITRDRGVVEMIKAIGIVNETMNVTLVIGGSFAPRSLEDEVREMPEFEFVDYRGFLPRKDVAEVLSEARAGIVVPQPFSHNKFGFMNKLFEYMSAGIPLVASDFPQWRPIVEDSKCGLLVDSLDPGAIAAAIRTIFEHPEDAAQMGKNGKNAVKTTYNWDNEKVTLFTLYENLLQNGEKTERM
ncbi:glycosyltransferase family 4 protein [Candidatus Latescibacterota bacterium]